MNLSDQIEEKNQDLSSSNKELLKRNKERKQFSFALSHNLRGSVTTYMGLIHLFKTHNVNKEEIIEHIDTSVEALNEIIKGLNAVLDINYGPLDRKMEEICLNEIIKKAWNAQSSHR